VLPFPIILWGIANDSVMANDLEDLDGAEGGPQPPQGRELVVDLRHMTIIRHQGRNIGPQGSGSISAD
jgi:hypothetical protein